MTQHGCLVSVELYLHYCSLNTFSVKWYSAALMDLLFVQLCF